ncbi:MAG: 5-(carboxyamino)imidazole ribonucleotide mutase [Mycoplasma sp.]
MLKNKIAIIMGSKNDFFGMEDATKIFDQMGVNYDVEVVSAHRTPEWMYDFAKNAHNHYDIIIAGAGGSAHLPGMVASLTILPVIGVPIFSDKFQGVDAVMSIVQMPKGTPVATMGVNNSANAALFACKILSLFDNTLLNKLKSYKENMKEDVFNSNKELKNKR